MSCTKKLTNMNANQIPEAACSAHEWRESVQVCCVNTSTALQASSRNSGLPSQVAQTTCEQQMKHSQFCLEQTVWVSLYNNTVMSLDTQTEK